MPGTSDPLPRRRTLRSRASTRSELTACSSADTHPRIGFAGERPPVGVKGAIIPIVALTRVSLWTPFGWSGTRRLFP
jgi:hypothetical protein